MMPPKRYLSRKVILAGKDSLKKRKTFTAEEEVIERAYNLAEDDCRIPVDTNNEPEKDPLMFERDETLTNHFERVNVLHIKTEVFEQPDEAANYENYQTTPELYAKQEPKSPSEIHEEPPNFSPGGSRNDGDPLNLQSDPVEVHGEPRLSSTDDLSSDVDDSKQQSDKSLIIEGVGLNVIKASECMQTSEHLKSCVICVTIIPHLTSSSQLTNELQRQILAAGKPLPTMKNLKTKAVNGRACGSIQNFDTKLYNGHSWLTGCEMQNKLFCWPCLIFNAKSNLSIWNSQGYSNLNGLNDAMEMHSRSVSHLRACLLHTSFCNTIKESTRPKEVAGNEKKKHNAMVSRNRAVIRRLIDAVCLLPMLEMSYCGSDESETSPIHSTYLEMVSLLSGYDTLLEIHLNSSENDKLTTNEIRCGLIKAVGNVLVNRIKQEVLEAKFVSVILDSSKLILLSDADALISTTLRYVNSDGLTQERFIGYSFLPKCSDVSILYDHLLNLNENFEFKDKLVAVSFDSVALSPPNLERELKNFRKKYPSVLLVHCDASQLNFVLQKYFLKYENCRILFSTLSSIAMFFSNSSKRREKFAAFVTKKSSLTEPMELNFAMCKEKTVYDHQLNFIGFFDDMIQNPTGWNEEEIVVVLGFRSFLSMFSTTFLLLVFAKLFEHINKLHRAFVEREFDVDLCTELQLTTKQLMFSERNNFDQLWQEVKDKTDKYPVLEPGLINSQDEYKNLFGEIIQAITDHLADRSTSLSKLAFFDMLNPTNFINYYQEFPVEQYEILKETFPRLFEFNRLKNEISALYGAEEFQNMLPHKLVPHLRSLNLHQSFPEAYKLWCLFLTLPNTNGSLDPTFSVWKRMKFVSETLGHQAKPQLSILSIENRLLKKIKKLPEFYEAVTEELANSLQCRTLIFK